MKYLDFNANLGEAECSSDTVKPSELLNSRLSELTSELSGLAAGSVERVKPLLDCGYILLDLERKSEAWQVAHEAFDIAIPRDLWLQAVEACDVMYQSEQAESIQALVHGIWLGVTYPIDPELSVAMLQHLVEETPDDSDGAAVAAATARYIVDLRAEGKQRDDLQFFSAQLLGQVARRHTNGACDTQELFDIWVGRLELDDPAKFLPRLATVLDVIVPADKWWFDRNVLRTKIPAE